jgi:hypothetical protein
MSVAITGARPANDSAFSDRLNQDVDTPDSSDPGCHFHVINAPTGDYPSTDRG